MCHLYWRLVMASRRGHTRETETEGGGVNIDDNGGEIDDNGLEEEDGGGMLRVGDEAAARSEAGVEATACSKAGDEVEASFGTEIEAVARWYPGQQKSKSTWRFQKIVKCGEREHET
jgi:hypothetical protein